MDTNQSMDPSECRTLKELFESIESLDTQSKIVWWLYDLETEALHPLGVSGSGECPMCEGYESFLVPMEDKERFFRKELCIESLPIYHMCPVCNGGARKLNGIQEDEIDIKITAARIAGCME